MTNEPTPCNRCTNCRDDGSTLWCHRPPTLDRFAAHRRYHTCAKQLDMLNGVYDGCPNFEPRLDSSRSLWRRIDWSFIVFLLIVVVAYFISLWAAYQIGCG
jgi:hypothetical protein